VLDHPYFAIPDIEGNFVLRGVPAGSYTVAGWHERVGERSHAVRVDPGQTMNVDLTLPVEEAE